MNQPEEFTFEVIIQDVKEVLADLGELIDTIIQYVPAEEKGLDKKDQDFIQLFDQLRRHCNDAQNTSKLNSACQ